MTKDKTTFNLNEIKVFVFDFDGVLTNNLVHLDQDGKEFVSCSRADGLAFDVLNKLKIPSYILSTELNSVVSERAKKLKITAIQGVPNKLRELKDLSKRDNFKIKNVLYVGNDLNDLQVMQICGFTACPSDSHPSIKKISDVVLKTPGGNGVARELLEDKIGLNFVEILY